jgi:hypothetical protein
MDEFESLIHSIKERKYHARIQRQSRVAAQQRTA